MLLGFSAVLGKLLGEAGYRVLHVFLGVFDHAVKGFGGKLAAVAVDIDAVAQRQRHNQPDNADMRRGNQREQHKERAEVDDHGLVLAHAQPESVEKGEHAFGAFARVARGGASLEPTVFLQVYQRPGQAAVVILQQIDGLFVGDAALLPQNFNVLKGVLCHASCLLAMSPGERCHLTTIPAGMLEDFARAS